MESSLASTNYIQSLCEKAYKEDDASAREAVSPHIEIFLSAEIRLCRVSTWISISNSFGFVKRDISNFVDFSGSSGIAVNANSGLPHQEDLVGFSLFFGLDILSLTDQGELDIV